MKASTLLTQKWPGSLREARRAVFLREPPPASEDFFSWFQQIFPNVATSPDPALVTRLLYSGLKVASEGKEIPLAYNLIEPFLEANSVTDTGKRQRSVLPFVKAISEALGVPFNHHSIDLHLARCIQQVPRERAIELLVEWHWFALPPSDPNAVHPITREKTIGTKYKSIIQRAKAVVQEAEVRDEDDTSLKQILKHLHRPLPPILVTRTDERILAVEGERHEALRQAVDEKKQAEIGRAYSLRLQRLHGCRANSCGGYIWRRRSENYRLFTEGDTLVTIWSEDRRAITRQEDGFVEFDLSSAHLAIGNFLFGGPELTKLLQGASVWPTLLEWIGYGPEDKQILKECVYAIAYGSSNYRQCSLLVRDQGNREQIAQALDLIQRKRKQGEDPRRIRQNEAKIKRRIRNFMRQEDPVALAAYNNLVTHPAIRELLEHRECYANKILSDGGAHDAFGKFQEIVDGSSQVISTLASSYEKWLLWPIYEAAFNRREFEVVLDQHDGVTIRFTRQDKDEARRSNHIERLQQAVQKRADQLGILTHLEIKNT